MLRKLRLRLTLINIAIVTLLLLLFVTGTYILMSREVFNQSEHLMSNIAIDVESGSFDKMYQFDNNTYFFVKVDKAGDIIEASAHPHLDQKHLPELIRKTMEKKYEKGEFEWHGHNYTFLKVPLEQGQGFVLVYANVEREMEVLGFLLAALSIAGIICMALAFYSSLFLADKALIPIKKSWQRQRDFVADASHELRTPLAVIQTNLELVMGNSNETVEEQAVWLENVQTEVIHMAKLVDDLLYLARIDSEQQILEVSCFSLDVAIYDVTKPIIPVADTKGIKLNLNIEPEVYFNGDEKRIKQLVVIMVDNAIKHTPTGGEVSMIMRNCGIFTEITISDTGEGIEHKHLDKIFERFYRIDNSRSKSIEGTGLGLSIAEWIAKSHNGSIKVSSTPGKGTTFSVILHNIS